MGAQDAKCCEKCLPSVPSRFKLDSPNASGTLRTHQRRHCWHSGHNRRVNSAHKGLRGGARGDGGNGGVGLDVVGRKKRTKGMYRQRIQKAWGHAAHRGWARLLLDRTRDLIIHGTAHRDASGVAMPTDEDDQDDHFLFNHPERGGGLCCHLGTQNRCYLPRSNPPH